MWKKIKERWSQSFHFFFGAPALMWQLLFFFAPLALIVVFSVFDRHGAGWTFTFKHFGSFLTLTSARIIARSLFWALCNAVLCFLIAYPIAYFLAFKTKRFKNLFLFGLILPFGTNFFLHVYAWYFVLEREGFLNTLLMKLHLIHEPLHILNSMVAVSILMVYYYLPFMVLPLYSALEKCDKTLLEASLDLGASWWQTIRKVMIPLTLPGILSGFFLVFVPSFTEFAIPELLNGDKTMFVGTVVSWYILGSGTISQGAAFTLISSACLLMMTGFLYWLIKRSVRML